MISYISFILCVASAVLTALNPVVRKWPGAEPHHYVATHDLHPGGLIVFIAIGESFLAFAMLMGSFGSLTNFMCNPAPKWRNLCKLQGFLLVSGLHVVITAYGPSCPLCPSVGVLVYVRICACMCGILRRLMEHTGGSSRPHLRATSYGHRTPRLRCWPPKSTGKRQNHLLFLIVLIN